MDEIIKKAEEIKEARKDDTPVGDKPQTTGLIDNASAVAKRLEAATEAAREERLANEAFAAKQQLAGRAEAGQETKPVTQADKDKEIADQMLKAFE